MVANLGYATLVITFLVSIYGFVAAYLGARRNSPALVDSARNAMLLTFPLLTITALSIIYLLVNGHYEIQYVSEVSSSSMPVYLRMTALWGGQSGSLLFWSWLMSAFASAVTLRKWDRDREFLPWVILVCLITLAFFLLLNLFVDNPFISLWQTPTNNIIPSMFPPAGATLFTPKDGNGLNPLLRHPGMIFHPPMLYLGYVSFVIPYAFAIAALIPWLTGTAFLHSVMIQEKRGILKQWNMLLIILTYDLVIFGTFLTRSGVLDSVHAFAQSAIGPLFFGFIGLTLITSLLLLSRRWNDLKSDSDMTSMFSREALFLLNNLLFFSVFFVCFLGVIFPVLSEAMGIIGQQFPPLAGIFTGQKYTVGPTWYKPIVSPIFAGLVLLMGIAPLSSWRNSTAKTIANALWKPFLLSLLVIPVLLLG